MTDDERTIEALEISIQDLDANVGKAASLLYSSKAVHEKFPTAVGTADEVDIYSRLLSMHKRIRHDQLVRLAVVTGKDYNELKDELCG